MRQSGLVPQRLLKTIALGLALVLVMPPNAWAANPRVASSRSKTSESGKAPDIFEKAWRNLRDRMARRNEWESGPRKIAPAFLPASQSAIPPVAGVPVHLSIRLIGANKVGIFVDDPSAGQAYDLFYRDTVNGQLKPLAAGVQVVDGKPIWEESALNGQRFYEVRTASGSQLTPAEKLKAPENAPYLAPYLQGANPVTGMTNSHLGDNPNGTFTYDMALLAMLDFGPNSAKILNTYATNSQKPASADLPQVQPRDGNFSPNGAILNDIRIKGFTGSWWETWDWSVHGGPNAWIGIAALQNYQRSPNPALLTFAKERAEFLISLQDTDGGLRMGPKGQYSPTGDLSFYWNIKSTENNEGALQFFDMLYEVTKDVNYKNTADRIWDYLKQKMFDKNEHAFFRGEHLSGGVWVRDSHTYFATDTATWAPMERILNDPFFGATRADRLKEVESLLDTSKKKTAVNDRNGKLVGVSFSIGSANVTKAGAGNTLKGIVSIEWTSQYALRRLAISEEWTRLGDAQAAGRNLQEYNSLIQTMGGFFRNTASGRVAPYAVWSDGSEAVLVDTGHGWVTPRGPGSVASDYFLFAQSGFDPLVLGGKRKS